MTFRGDPTAAGGMTFRAPRCRSQRRFGLAVHINFSPPIVRVKPCIQIQSWWCVYLSKSRKVIGVTFVFAAIVVIRMIILKFSLLIHCCTRFPGTTPTQSASFVWSVTNFVQTPCIIRLERKSNSQNRAVGLQNESFRPIGLCRSMSLAVEQSVGVCL